MIQVNNLTFYVTTKCIFNSASLAVKSGDRIGLVGPNGAGKTTLLRMIDREFEPDEGSIDRIGNVSAGFLRQEALELNINQSIKELALRAFEEANRLETELHDLTMKLTEITDYTSDRYQKMLDDIEHKQSRYDMLDGSRKESKTEAILEGLGFETEDLNRPLAEFSGGWRMRVLLAKILLEQPDVLLLDEPTNHLDIDSIEWLEQYLRSYQGAVVIVSHDRYFLDRMVTTIAEVRQKKLYRYEGNFESYLEQRQEQVDQQRIAYETQQREIAEMEKFITRFRAKASKAKLVQSRVKALERMVIMDEPEPEMDTISFRFPEPPRSGKVVMHLDGLNKTYNEGKDNETPVFTHNQDLHIERGDKVAIIGPNGAGKSTLARIIFGNEEFDGEREEGHNVKMAFFAQHLSEVLKSDNTVLEEMEQHAPTPEIRKQIRTLLGSFLFQGDDVFKPISVLSGGERSRLALAKTLLEPANLMVLDEPTNHLDIQSKDMLVDALKQFKGTILLISHDRYFLKGISEKIWRVEHGKVIEYDGGFDYYEWKRGKEQEIINDQKSENKSSSKDAKNKSEITVEADASAPKSKEQKRLEAQLRNKLYSHTKKQKDAIHKIEKELEKLEAEKKELSDKMAEVSFYESDEAPEAMKNFNKLEQKIDRLTEDWTMKQMEVEEIEDRVKAELGLDD
jgi:ATP-binding cassette subfamily F protein 3